MAKPPPLPPQANRPTAKPTVGPGSDGFLSTREKLSLTDAALALRDEQLAARVIHYKGYLETNKELDAITERVVAEIRELQAASLGRIKSAALPEKATLEIELIRSLKQMLSRIFRRDRLSSVLTRALAEATKRFARAFFESELSTKLKGASAGGKKILFPEQALHLALQQVTGDIEAALGCFEYSTQDVRLSAKYRFDDFVRQLQSEFLGRTTPQLNLLVCYLTECLTTLFTIDIPAWLGDISWEVVKEARLADAMSGKGYKIAATAFPAFRSAFERRFVERLVALTREQLIARVRQEKHPWENETVHFLSDPQIFSDICELVCDGVYEVLYNDGFLDLPPDWRAQIRVQK